MTREGGSEVPGVILRDAPDLRSVAPQDEGAAGVFDLSVKLDQLAPPSFSSASTMSQVLGPTIPSTVRWDRC